MRVGLSIPNFAEPGRLLDIARAAEAGGWDGWFLWDHILVDREHAVPVSEPWTVLAAAAVTTSRIRLGTMVTPIAQRRPSVWRVRSPPSITCRKDGPCWGRAWRAARGRVRAVRRVCRSEHHAALVDEGLTVLNALWQGEPVTHRGPAYTLDGGQFAPRPVRRPRPCRFGRRARYRLVLACGGLRGGTASCRSMPETEFRPATPDEVAAAVADIANTRGTLDDFEVAVWTVADDHQTLAARTSRQARRGSSRALLRVTTGSTMPPASPPPARPLTFSPA